jgi:hypothetical protein
MGQSVLSKGSRKWPAVSCDLEELAREITRLPALDAAALREKWAALFGAEPSSLLGRALLIQAIAHRLQERTLGGLKPSAQRILDRIGEGASKSAVQRMARARAGAGTVLIREWGGASHRVTVLDNDVVYQGRRYKSLSEVARVITGTRWSGPLFFGLTRRASEAANG